MRDKSETPLITLLTDFGSKDAYVGVMKGVILGINPSAKIIDLCHDVSAQDVFEAGYVLGASYKYFPKGTIHVAVVDPGVGSDRKIMCLKAFDYIFLAPDNGLLSVSLAGEKPTEIVEVTNKRYFLSTVSRTFHGRDIFAPVAAHLSKQTKMSSLGKKISRIERIDLPKPVRSPAGILRGEVIYIDRFGNLITNITRDTLQTLRLTEFSELNVRIGKGCKAKQQAGSPLLRKISGITGSYMNAASGQLLALFGSSDHLEISVNQGSAQRVLSAKKGTKIEVVLGKRKT